MDDVEKERLRQIIDLVPHHIFAITADGRFLFINQALADVYGMAPEDVVGKRQRDITPVQDQEDRFLEDDREVVRTGKRQVIHNLVINAVQAMPAGGRLVVAARNLDGPEIGMPIGEGNYVLLTVSDTGGGILCKREKTEP